MYCTVDEKAEAAIAAAATTTTAAVTPIFTSSSKLTYAHVDPPLVRQLFINILYDEEDVDADEDGAHQGGEPLHDGPVGVLAHDHLGGGEGDGGDDGERQQHGHHGVHEVV